MNSDLDIYVDYVGSPEEYLDIDDTEDIFTHTTKNGRTISIKNLDNDHLYNIIKYIIDKMEDIFININAKKTIEDLIVKKNVDTKKSIKDLKNYYVFIQRYIFEATLRDINIVVLIVKLRDILGYKLEL